MNISNPDIKSELFSPLWMNSVSDVARLLCNAMQANVERPDLCVPAVQEVFEMATQATGIEALALCRLTYQMADFLFERQIKPRRMQEIQSRCTGTLRALSPADFPGYLKATQFLQENDAILSRPFKLISAAKPSTLEAA